jgi:hypothetical protein
MWTTTLFQQHLSVIICSAPVSFCRHPVTAVELSIERTSSYATPPNASLSVPSAILPANPSTTRRSVSRSTSPSASLVQQWWLSWHVLYCWTCQEGCRVSCSSCFVPRLQQVYTAIFLRNRTIFLWLTCSYISSHTILVNEKGTFLRITPLQFLQLLQGLIIFPIIVRKRMHSFRHTYHHLWITIG